MDSGPDPDSKSSVNLKAGSPDYDGGGPGALCSRCRPCMRGAALVQGFAARGLRMTRREVRRWYLFGCLKA